MRYAISRTLLARILAEAAADAREVCGLLLGEADGGGGRIAEARPCRNVAATPATRFEIDPAALIAAYRQARGGGPAIIGHYHSHPGGVAAPSPRDAADAAPDGRLWLIAGGGEARGWRAVRDGAVHGRFDPVALDVFDACAGDSRSPQGG